MASSDLENELYHAGIRFGCDKVVPHAFHVYYARHLANYKHATFKLLEIGVGGEAGELGGASLKMWQEVFPNVEICALDIYPKNDLDTDRIKTFVVDQGDVEALQSFVELNGPFDVIIDDGSHKRSDQLASLFNLIDHVVPGGLYVLEDYFTSYWPVYDGSTLAKDFLDTPVRWLKQSIDIINRENILSAEVKNLLPDWGIEELHVYPGVAFLMKTNGLTRSDIPVGDFLENQRELDMLRYGKLKEYFISHMKDPMHSLAELTALRDELDDLIAQAPDGQQE